MRSAFFALLFGLPLLAGLAACDDPLDRGPVLLLQDTVVIAVPAEGQSLPSAFDMARDRAPGLLRYPERPEHAGEWDFALRRADGALVLRTFEPGLDRPRPGLSASNEAFEQMEAAPLASGRYVSDPVTLVEGVTYYLRSRQTSSPFGGACIRFGRMQVMSLDVAAGTAELALAINDSCNDERLVPET